MALDDAEFINDLRGIAADVNKLVSELQIANAALATSLDLAARSIHASEHKGSFESCKVGFCHQRAEITERYRLK